MKNQFILPAICAIALAATISVGNAATPVKTLPAKVNPATTTTQQESPYKGGEFKGKSFADMSPADREKMQQKREERRQEFETRLNLTDKQKELAKANQEKGKKELEPIMAQMKPKFEKIQEIKQSNLSDEEKTTQINAVREELKPLKAQANEIRKKNMADFEAILTDDQKAELAKMKAEKAQQRGEKGGKFKDKDGSKGHHGKPAGQDSQKTDKTKS